MSKIKELLYNLQLEHGDDWIIEMNKDLVASEWEYYATKGSYNK